MGLNFYAGCHRCKTKQFFFRGDEAKSMHRFWGKHANCIRADKKACVIQGDGYGEQDWMTDYADDEPESSPAHDGSAPQYVIATVGDFLKVPEDRLADCLSEFVDFLGMARGIVELASIAGEVVGVDAAAQFGPFIWIDDGKKNRTIRIKRKLE